MKKDPDGVVAFSLFSTDLISRLREVLKEKERAFLFAARRGLAPIVACVDCGHIMRSPESGEPLSLHRRMKDGAEERWFVSSVSGYRERARDVCPSCSGWRLRERGIGIQHVYDELVEAFPEAPIVLFDHTTATTPKKAAMLRDSFYTTKGVFLLGTALAIPYLVKPVKMSAVVSLDSLKAIPSWRQQEEALGLILTLREKTSGTVLIQTRSDDDGLLEFAEKGSIEAFYDHELTLRETYQYPPFSTFIHLTWQGPKESVLKVERTVSELFAPHNITVYGSPESDGETAVRYGLIRVPAARWPDAEITTKLRTLSPAIRIMINPDRII